MLKNYIKIALRSLLKQKVYTIINVLGLSVGLASCLLIVLYISHEFSYDQFHEKKDRIFKMALERKYPNHATYYAVIPHSFAEVMVSDFPEVASTIKMAGPFNDVPVVYRDEKNEEKRFEEDLIMTADSNFFKVFTFKFLKGDPAKAFTTRNDIVITEETANRYFGTDDPIGKIVSFFGQDFKVSGVSENVPVNSHFRFNFLIRSEPNNFGNGGNAPNFTSFSAHVYVELRPGADAGALEARFPEMVDRYAAAEIETELGKSWEDYKKEGNGYRYFLQPLTSIHLDPTNIEAKIAPGGNLQYMYFLVSIAVLIIIIACINFMNLATARSAERAREVGVRKTMGSLRGQLISQFLTESILLSVFSIILALAIASLTLPYFNTLVGKQLIIDYSLTFFIVLIGIAVIVGFLAGTYPAFALSSFNPISVMKGNFSSNKTGTLLRNGLVVFQFFISIVLITGTLVVTEQMTYMQNKSLGYDKEHILVVESVFALQDKVPTFIEELKAQPNVESAASSFAMLGRQRDFFGAFYMAEGMTEVLTVKTMVIDDDFSQTIGFQFAGGMGFSKDIDDSLSVILNETAVKTLGLTDPLGKKISRVQRTPNGAVNVPLTIVGVIKDFNFQTLRDPITPLAIQNTENFGGGAVYAYARIKGANMPEAISQIESKWHALAPPGQPFKYQFLDENLMAQYEAEKTAGKVFAVFSGLAIIIACVGLFGLTAYTAGMRTKEIGVRKVMGASVASVVMLLSKDFTKLILIAFGLAVPLAWYLMNNWLQEFAYRIELGAKVFLFAGLIAVLISWITVSYQSIKAAIVNPIKSLRSE